MSRQNTSFEKKYRYLLYRVQQALLEMEQQPRTHRGRRHLENGLYGCEGFFYTSSNHVSHQEMMDIKAELFQGDTECDHEPETESKTAE